MGGARGNEVGGGRGRVEWGCWEPLRCGDIIIIEIIIATIIAITTIIITIIMITTTYTYTYIYIYTHVSYIYIYIYIYITEAAEKRNRLTVNKNDKVE